MTPRQRRTARRAAERDARKQGGAPTPGGTSASLTWRGRLRQFARRPMGLLLLISVPLFLISTPLVHRQQQRAFEQGEVAAFTKRHASAESLAQHSPSPAVSQSLVQAMRECVVHFPPDQAAQFRVQEAYTGQHVEQQCSDGVIATIYQDQGLTLANAASSELHRLGYTAMNFSPEARDAYLPQLHPVFVRWDVQSDDHSRNLVLVRVERPKA